MFIEGCRQMILFVVSNIRIVFILHRMRILRIHIAHDFVHVVFYSFPLVTCVVVNSTGGGWDRRRARLTGSRFELPHLLDQLLHVADSLDEHVKLEFLPFL